MNCSDMQSLFSASLDKELDPSAAVLFDRHLESCHRCRYEWMLFQETMRAVHDLEPIPVPPDLLPGIHAKLEEPGLLRKIIALWHGLDFSMSLPAAAATIAAAVAIGVFFKISPLEAPQTPAGIQALSPGHQAALSSTYQPSAKRLILRPQPATSLSRSRGQTFAPLRTLPAHPPITAHAGHVRPDIIVTLSRARSKQVAALYKELAGRTNWQTHLAGNTLMVRLPAVHLPMLDKMFSRHHITLSPAGTAGLPSGRSHQPVLVAVRLR